MFCPNCGKKIEKEEEICPFCKHRIEKKECNSLVKTSQETFVEELSKNNVFIPLFRHINLFFKKSFSFVRKHKKTFLVGIASLSLFLLSFGIFLQVYDFTTLTWDEQQTDYQISYTEPTTLNLKVFAYDKEKHPITNIKFQATGGKINAKETEVSWMLPKKKGTYTILAKSPSGKTITKKVEVILLPNSNENPGALLGLQEKSKEEEVDFDQDGFTDKKEKELGTDSLLKDSDQDGLMDSYEVEVSQTNPLKKDSDQDGLLDGDELDLGLDPLKKDSKGDGIEDGKRKLQYVVENNTAGVSLELSGTGNLASSTIDVFLNKTFAEKEGILGKIYQFSTPGKLESATVRISYKEEEIAQKNIKEEHLTLYYFDEEKKELEEVPTTLDRETKILTATLNHFSKYVIGDKTRVSTKQASDVLFVIDNSVSMYSLSQMEKAGHAGSTGAIGNDTTFQRMVLTNQMMDRLQGNYRFGVIEFSGNAVQLQGFTSDIEQAKKKVNQMKSHWESYAHGTNIIEALEDGISSFTKKENSRALILLTDGKNTEGSLSSEKENLIQKAKEKQIKVCVIGLGDELDTEDLKEIAENTGCNYYHASNASSLDEIYNIVGADINYDYIDTDKDNEIDGMILKDSGFVVNRDGFSFQNFFSNKSEEGHCYGMATFAMLYYKDELPLQLDELDLSKFYLRYMKKVSLASNGYDLTNTYFSTKKKLYDFKITNKALSIFVGDTPADYRDHIEKDTWMINKKYADEMKKIGATITTKKVEGEKDFTKYQSARLNIDNDTFNNNLSKDESEVINAIWRLFILQAEAKKTAFSSAPDKAYKQLQDELSSGTPSIVNVDDSHAINAIKLIQENDDANHFKIEVYDNNYPGDTRYVDVIRKKFNKIQLNYTAWVNEYEYQFKYDMNNDGKEEEISFDISNPTIQ